MLGALSKALSYKPKHSFKVGTHRKKPMKAVAGRHRTTAKFDTNYFSGGHKPKHGRKLFGLF